MSRSNVGKIVEVLRDNILFFELSDQTLLAVARTGKVMAIEEGEKIHDCENHLYVILTGRVYVEREETKHSTDEIVLPSCFSFGFLDPDLGLGKCLGACGIDTAALFCISKLEFADLIENHEDLRVQIQTLKKTMIYHSSGSKMDHHHLTQQMLTSIQRGGRLFLKDSKQQVLVNQSLMSIKNISIFGLFVQGENTLTLDTKIEFTNKILSQKLRARVVRLTDEGAGLRIQFENESQRKTWLNYLGQISSDIQSAHFQNQMYVLPNSMDVQISKQNEIFSADLCAVSEVEIILNCKSAMRLGTEFKVHGLLHTENGKFPVRMVAKVKESTQLGYRATITNMDSSVRDMLHSYLDTARSELPSKNAHLPKPLIIYREFKDANAFQKAYQNEWVHGLALLPVSEDILLGKTVEIQIKVRLNDEESDSFEMLGKVSRELSNDRFVAELAPFDNAIKRKISNILQLKYTKMRWLHSVIRGFKNR